MMAATRWPWRATPSAPTWNTRCPSSKAVPCPMCATASSPCSGAFCMRWTAWAWATAAPRATRRPSPSRAPAWWAMCWAASTPTATSRPTTRWCAWRRTSASATRSIDGQGNFGSRDGDGAAAMRYTEARLSAHHQPAARRNRRRHGGLSCPTTTAAREEPRQLPARLPFALLNGASGIAVGLATEIPSHNLREVADACVALIKTPERCAEDRAAGHRARPGLPRRRPDHQQRRPTLRDAYRTGRGSLKVRARWKIEDTGARPVAAGGAPSCRPACSTQSVLEEIEEISNPKVKAGKKALTQEQQQLKATHAGAAGRGARRIEQGRAGAPGDRAQDRHDVPQQELITALLAHTSLETSAPINLTMVGLDGRAGAEALRQMLVEWIAFPPAHDHAGAASTGWTRCSTASISWKGGSWCCSTSTR